MEDVERLISREALRELSGRWKGLEWVGRKIKMIFWRLPLMVFSGCCVSAFYAHIGPMSILFGGLLDSTSSQREWRLRGRYIASCEYAIAFILSFVCDASIWAGYIAVTHALFIAGMELTSVENVV